MDQGSREGRTFCFDVIISATIFARRKSAGGNMIGLNQQRKSHASSRSFGGVVVWVWAHFPEQRLVIEPTSIPCRNFEKIIDWTISFRKIGKCTQVRDGFCFGFNHILSRFYWSERIHNPVSVTQSSWKEKQMGFEWKYLRNNVYAYSFVFAMTLIQNKIMRLQNPCCI